LKNQHLPSLIKMINTYKLQVIIVFASMVLFVPFLGQVHLFDWDEINFAECAREMLASGNYFSVQINYQPFWEKPPLFIWMQAGLMNIFGVNEFAARLPNAICGIITLLILFNIGKKIFNQQFALWWIFVYASSFLPHFYFKSGIIDPWFNLFIFSSLYYFVLFIEYKTIRYILFSAILLGLAVLTKGPAALLIVGLCITIYWIKNKFNPFIKIWHLFVFGICVLAIGGLWFLILSISGNYAIIQEFFTYQIRLFNTQDSGHGGPFFYHWIVLLIGCFPMSIIALRAFGKQDDDKQLQKTFKQFMFILFWVVLILFSIVKTKIVHYSSLCYYPLSFMCAYAIYKLLSDTIKWKKTTSLLLLIIASVIGIALIALPFIDKYKNAIINSGIIHDKFAVENLKANVYWSGYEWLIGVVFILGVIVSTIMFKRNNIRNGLILLFTTSLITVNTALTIIVPRIEQYSQGAVIAFYKNLQGKDCYVETLGFKSYAHLFYSHMQPNDNINRLSMDWLLYSDTGKPTYFVSKIQSAEEIKAGYPHLKELYRKNGFVFYSK
jgi:4-amino-4-deoxy-L-arabinose transferase-like glycosyltransferase